MEFKQFSVMEIISMLLANLVAIAMAFSGFGYWALVLRIFLQRFSLVPSHGTLPNGSLQNQILQGLNHF